MHGYQSYPTSINDTNLNRILHFKDIFGKIVNMAIKTTLPEMMK